MEISCHTCETTQVQDTLRNKSSLGVRSSPMPQQWASGVSRPPQGCPSPTRPIRWWKPHPGLALQACLPARGSQEMPLLWETTRNEGSFLWKTPVSRICQTEHVSSTSPKQPSPRPWTLVAFSIVVFFLLKTGLLLCTQKGSVCGAQLHFKGTLLVSYEFACLY